MFLPIYQTAFRAERSPHGHFRTVLLFCTVLAAASSCPAQSCGEQPFIRNLHVYGGENETNLPVIIRGGATDDSVRYAFITIRFDVNETAPPRLQIRFSHCDEDWNPDTDPSYRDDFYLYTRSLHYRKAQPSARHIAWRFQNSFPSVEHPFVRFLHSGNWVFDIVDERDQATVYASGRFMVVDNILRPGISVHNDYWPGFTPPANRVHRLDLRLTVPDGLVADFVTTVDFYRNRRLFEPYRVTSERFETNTRFDGLGRREKWFSYQNVIPGNGYRIIDFRSPTQNPTGYIVVRQDGPDYSRLTWGADRNVLYGSALATDAGSWDADFLCVRFELLLPPFRDRDVFVAGMFNQWDPREEDRMTYRSETGTYILDRWLFRGAYEYQYVTGRYDAELGYVSPADWVELEGSFWETSNEYWAIVYYRDPRYGRLTHAMGFARQISGGLR